MARGLAKYDSNCRDCGQPIIGYLKHGHETAQSITWSPRGAKGAIHSSPSCDEVRRGILLRDDIRNGAEQPEPEETAPAAAPVAPAPESAAVSPAAIAQILAALQAGGVAIPAAVSAALAAAPKATKAKLIDVGATWYAMLEALLTANCRRVLLPGPPGTGKSFTSAAVAARVSGKKTYSVTMTEGTGVEDLLGQFVLVSDGKTSVTKWVDGPATRAALEGATLVINEITHVPAEIESLQYLLMDDNPIIYLPDGREIAPAEGYTVIGTTNDNAAQLPPALMDRCEAIVLAMTPHVDALRDCGAAERAICTNYYRSVDSTPYRFTRSPQCRPVRSFAKLSKAGTLTAEAIAAVVFGDAAKEFLSALSTAASKGGK